MNHRIYPFHSLSTIAQVTFKDRRKELAAAGSVAPRVGSGGIEVGTPLISTTFYKEA